MADRICNVEEWRALPEIMDSAPASGSGSFYFVHTVGFLLVDGEQCGRFNIQPLDGIGEMVALPTAVVEVDRTTQLCRLPLSLTSWAIDAIGLVSLGAIKFPMGIEFRVLDGLPYANWDDARLLAQSKQPLSN